MYYGVVIMGVKNKGFVLMETIVVISVLCVVLVVLYAAYSSLISSVHKKSLYDNTEYLYKTSVIRKELEADENVVNVYKSGEPYIYCSDLLSKNTNSIKSCTSTSDLFEFMKVKGVYFSSWDLKGDTSNYEVLEATTQRYLRSLDPKHIEDAYRIIVMFSSENSEDENEYEYASLRFGSRG